MENADVESKFLVVTEVLNAKFVTEDKYCMLITCNGMSSGVYATYLVQGYGKTAARTHVTALHIANNALPYKILDDESGITISSNQQWDCSVLALYGKLPTVTKL